MSRWRYWMSGVCWFLTCLLMTLFLLPLEIAHTPVRLWREVDDWLTKWIERQPAFQKELDRYQRETEVPITLGPGATVAFVPLDWPDDAALVAERIDGITPKPLPSGTVVSKMLIQSGTPALKVVVLKHIPEPKEGA